MVLGGVSWAILGGSSDSYWDLKMASSSKKAKKPSAAEARNERKARPTSSQSGIASPWLNTKQALQDGPSARLKLVTSERWRAGL